MRRSLKLPLLLVWFAACGTSDGGADSAPDAGPATLDISGFYDNVEMLSGACGSPEPSNLAPPLIKIDSLQSTFYVRSCQSRDDADCPSIYYDFNTPIENGWAAEGGSAFYSAQCTLSWERSTATVTDGRLSVHTLRYESLSDIAQGDCTLQAASALETPCANETLLTADAADD